jgi:hypothetical protein
LNKEGLHHRQFVGRRASIIAAMQIKRELYGGDRMSLSTFLRISMGLEEPCETLVRR